ncbi:MAG: hypothetical protein QW613_07185, partial [Thermoprotei archaeon]
MSLGYREIKIHSADKPFEVDKEVLAQLRELKLSRKFIDSMKRDAVECPWVEATIPALKCMGCPYFVRRFKGYIHCGY